MAQFLVNLMKVYMQYRVQDQSELYICNIEFKIRGNSRDLGIFISSLLLPGADKSECGIQLKKIVLV